MADPSYPSDSSQIPPNPWSAAPLEPVLNGDAPQASVISSIPDIPDVEMKEEGPDAAEPEPEPEPQPQSQPQPQPPQQQQQQPEPTAPIAPQPFSAAPPPATSPAAPAPPPTAASPAPTSTQMPPARGSPHPTQAPAPPAHPLPHGSPTRVYLNEKVTPHLLEGMKYLAANEPQKPLKWLAEYLMERSKEFEGE